MAQPQLNDHWLYVQQVAQAIRACIPYERPKKSKCFPASVFKIFLEESLKEKRHLG